MSDPQFTSPVFVDAIDRLRPGARILVGLSGGVDSSVAAALLKSRGFDVVGVSLHLWEDREHGSHPSRCCAPEDLDDARASAEAIGVPHFVFDRQSQFRADVVAPFVDAYTRGVTPSPCVACNRDVKISALVELCRQLGADAFATGHYARAGFLVEGEHERRALLTGVDRDKDQSYFLFGIGADAIAKMVTPLGATTKPAVREIARKYGLGNANKPDSEDLCFTGGDHAGFVERAAKEKLRPGPIVDDQGRVVGNHDGVHRFTVGQRKGLGVSLGRPVFVASIDASTATVRLGDAASLEQREAIVDEAQWLAPRAIEAGPRELHARVRYRHEGAPATVTRLDDRRVHVHFASPVRAITPGQTCVFYAGEEVVGGGRITGSARVANAVTAAP